MVEVLNAGAFTFTTSAITGTMTNFGTAVQEFDSDAANVVDLAAATVATPATTTIVLTKTYKNTMDIGKFSFAVTLGEIASWDKAGKALITFPSYYNAHLGEGVRCSLKTSDGTTEALYCELKWDWTLEVWGPRTNAQAKDTAFDLIVTGVTQNNAATAESFCLTFSNETLGAETYQEFGLVVDTVETTAWVAVAPFDVTKITASKLFVRGKTNVDIEFTLSATTGTVTNGGDYVSVTFPSNWKSYISASSIGKVEVSSLNSEGAATSIGTTVLDVSGTTIVVGVDATGVTFAEGTSYKVSLKDVPTPGFAGKVDMARGSMVIGVGAKASGGTGWSSSSLFNFE